MKRLISDNYVTGDNIYLRELQNFFFEVLGMMSITHYGAIGDGRRDNYGPLQVAIDDANRRGLSFLYVPYGKFIYTGELQNLIDPDTGKQRIIFMGNPHAHIVNIRTGEEIEIHQFGWCEGHEGDVGIIDAGDLELVDGTDISLNKDKIYRVNSLKINGAADGEFINAIVAVSSVAQPNSTKTMVTLLSSHNAIKDVNGWLYRAYLYTNDEWVLSSYNRNATTEIDENATDYELPTAKAVKDYVGANYYTKDEIDYLLLAKQDRLIAGENITIENNVISASSGGGGGTTVTPFFSCPFPTSWSGSSTAKTATNTFGTWSISTDGPINQGSISDAFDGNNTTKVDLITQNAESRLNVVIELPSNTTIKPAHIKLNYNAIEYSIDPCVFQGYNPSTSSWETLYTLSTNGGSGQWPVDADITTANYFSKFRLSNIHKHGSHGVGHYIYEIQVNSGYIKEE